MSFKYLFQALVRPHLEYAAAVWSPYKSGEIEQIIEIVQRRAMKQIYIPYFLVMVFVSWLFVAQFL
jgi:hypothetical protein